MEQIAIRLAWALKAALLEMGDWKGNSNLFWLYDSKEIRGIIALTSRKHISNLILGHMGFLMLITSR